MNFIIAADTDVGLVKEVNQDSLMVMRLHTPQGEMAFAVVCDGMGGHAKGEVASANVVRAFRKWATEELPKLCVRPLEDTDIRRQWKQIVQEQSDRIKHYASRFGASMGTTLVAVLLTQSRYYILNIGDSRAYEITSGMRQITNDHSYIAREIAMGRLTEEEAAVHPLRNGLLRGIGTSGELEPEMFFGAVKSNAVYMLCSDGFRHEISSEEMYTYLNPAALTDPYTMKAGARTLIELNKWRKELDNISVALIRTC